VAGPLGGGNGGVRRVRFLEPMTASILSNGRHRRLAWPAASRSAGHQPVVRADGRVELLDHIGQAEMQPGDVFEIHTPGGGGFGATLLMQAGVDVGVTDLIAWSERLSMV
jgi:5-oxoprolinase (ATP-hydrolysing)